MLRGMLRKALLIAYIIVGLIVASSHHYFAHLNGAKPILSAVLAVVLWPLVLLGVNLHIKRKRRSKGRPRVSPGY